MSRIVKQKAPRKALLRELIQPLYDTTDVASSGDGAYNLQQFFLRPLGDTIPLAATIKTEADTNMSAASKLGTPNRFEMTGFQYKWMNVDPDDLDQTAPDLVDAYEQSVFNFFFGTSRIEWQFPLSRIPSGTMLTGNASSGDTTGAVEYGFLHNGRASVKEAWDVTISGQPVKIGPEETFFVEITWPNGAVTSASADRRRAIMLLIGSLFTQL